MEKEGDASEKTFVYGYVRVSTKDQSYEAQEEAILKYCKMKGWEIARIFGDKASGKNMERVNFQKMMGDLDLNPLGVKVIVIYKLDRIGRNLRDLIDIAETLRKKDISLVSMSDSIDTTTPMGKLAFHILGALSEYERSIILERTKLGREYAMEHKTAKFGRKKKHLNMELISRLILEGVPKRKIARDFRISPKTLYDRFDEYKLKGIVENGEGDDKKTKGREAPRTFGAGLVDRGDATQVMYPKRSPKVELGE